MHTDITLASRRLRGRNRIFSMFWNKNAERAKARSRRELHFLHYFSLRLCVFASSALILQRLRYSHLCALCVLFGSRFTPRARRTPGGSDRRAPRRTRFTWERSTQCSTRSAPFMWPSRIWKRREFFYELTRSRYISKLFSLSALILSLSSLSLASCSFYQRPILNLGWRRNAGYSERF